MNNNPPLALIDEPVVQRASENRNLNRLISKSELLENGLHPTYATTGTTSETSPTRWAAGVELINGCIESRKP